MNESLISIENLHVHFNTYAGQVHAVNGASFEIKRGEIFGLVGESGCGKTMTGLSMLRLVPPPGEIVAGRITFDGQDILSLSEQEIRQIRGKRIAMIFQDPSTTLNPVFTIGEQIGLVIREHQAVNRKVAGQRILEILEMVGLPDPPQIAKAYPHELSGGMQQRVMIALALVSNASMLIADEPTTALDVTIQAQILKVLTQLKESQGLSILLITHNLAVVAETCDRVAVLYVGYVVEKGRTRDIFKDMKHPYTQGLLEAIPHPGSHGDPLKIISGSVASGLTVFHGCPFEPRCSFAMEVCRQAPPPMVQVGKEHYVACYLFVEDVSK